MFMVCKVDHIGAALASDRRAAEGQAAELHILKIRL
jgi:hypothetical protein